MRYQDLRHPRGAGEFWLQLRLRLTRPIFRSGPVGRLDGLSEHQLRDLGLDPRATEADPAPLWRLVR